MTNVLALRKRLFDVPLWSGVLRGAVFALLVPLLDYVMQDVLRDDVVAFMFFAFAAGLIYQDLIDSAAIARKETTRFSAHGWMYIYAIGMGWGVPMLVLMWNPDVPDATNIGVWLSAGLLFGLFMNLQFDAETVSQTLEDYYQTDKPSTERNWGGKIYFLWPIVSISLILLIALDPPDDGWGGHYVIFQCILMLGLVTLFQPKVWWQSPRLFGMAILVITLLST